jgi:outer membrane protein
MESTAGIYVLMLLWRLYKMIMQFRVLPRVLLVLCLLGAGGTAIAADTDNEPGDQLTIAAATQQGSGWIFGGGLAVTNPGYVGYDRQVTPIPLIFYHNGRFLFAGFSAGYLLAGDRRVRLSAVVVPQINRLSASDSPQLAGIQTRQWSIDGGLSLDVSEDWGNFRLSVLHDLLDRNNGTQANTGYDYPFHIDGWTLSPGLGIRWEDASTTAYYYGVSPAEAIPGRPAYAPGSALSPYARIGLSTSLSEHWQFRSFIEYTRFSSAIHDSPIVDRSGSATIFIGVTYSAGQL